MADKPVTIRRERIGRQIGHLDDLVTFEQLLGSQSRPEVQILGADQGQDGSPERFWEPAATGPAAFPGYQIVGTLLGHGDTQSLIAGSVCCASFCK
jgi:hypothetical protein